MYDVNIVLDPLELEDHIAGVALDVDGNPLPGQSIQFGFDDESLLMSAYVLTDDQGAFDLVVVRRSPHTFSLKDDETGQLAVVRSVEPGTLDVVLQLSDEDGIELIVKNVKDEPVTAFALVTRTLFGEGRAMSRHEDYEPESGRLKLSVPAEQFEFEVRASGYITSRLGPYDAANCPSEIYCSLEDRTRCSRSCCHR